MEQIVQSHDKRWEIFSSWKLCIGQHYKFQHHPRWRSRMKTKCDLQKAREVIVGLCNTVL